MLPSAGVGLRGSAHCEIFPALPRADRHRRGALHSRSYLAPATPRPRLVAARRNQRIVKVHHYWASTDEGAVARRASFLAEDPTLIGFELRDRQRLASEERRWTDVD